MRKRYRTPESLGRPRSNSGPSTVGRGRRLISEKTRSSRRVLFSVDNMAPSPPRRIPTASPKDTAWTYAWRITQMNNFLFCDRPSYRIGRFLHVCPKRVGYVCTDETGTDYKRLTVREPVPPATSEALVDQVTETRERRKQFQRIAKSYLWIALFLAVCVGRLRTFSAQNLSCWIAACCGLGGSPGRSGATKTDTAASGSTRLSSGVLMFAGPLSCYWGRPSPESRRRRVRETIC